jgi:heme exporter protein A
LQAAFARVGASRFADRPVRTLSAGQRRRIALAGLYLAGASLWLLDEPTTNLDAAGQQLMRSLIEEQLAGGGLVIAATHQDLGLDARQQVSLQLGGTA